MRRGRGVAVVVAALCLAVACCGCRTASSTGARPELEVSKTETWVRPPEIESVEGTAPAMVVREYALPGGCSLKGYDGRFAVFYDRSISALDDSPIRLLDLETGKHAQVRAQAVGAADGFAILGLRCSDEWVVWEELKGNEQEAPLKCYWRLFAAPIHKDGISLGEPVVVDENEVSIASRPLFAVVGDEVFWMTNSSANTVQEGAVDGARVRAKVLPDGTMREVLSGTRHIRTLSASEGHLLVSEYVDSKGAAERLLVVDPASGSTEETYDLGNVDRPVSHFPVTHDGAVTWAVLPDPEGVWCDLLYQAADGAAGTVEDHAGDPVMVGPYIFYETERPESTGTGTTKPVMRIRGFDPRSGARFTLLETSAQVDSQWRLPIAQAYDTDSFLVMNDLSLKTAESPDTTLVRRYTLTSK